MRWPEAAFGPFPWNLTVNTLKNVLLLNTNDDKIEAKNEGK